MGSQVQTTRSVMNPMHCDDDEGMVVVEEDQHAAYRDPYGNHPSDHGWPSNGWCSCFGVYKIQEDPIAWRTEDGDEVYVAATEIALKPGEWMEVVFRQLESGVVRTGRIYISDLENMLTYLNVGEALAGNLMTKLDEDNNGSCDENEWVQGLNSVPELKMLLKASSDPVTGRIAILDDKLKESLEGLDIPDSVKGGSQDSVREEAEAEME